MAIDLRTGRSVWSLQSASTTTHQSLRRNLRADVLVIGAGISGSLIAHELSKCGREVTMVDRRDVGRGSTMASTAMLSYEADVNLVDLIEKRGKGAAVRAYRAGIEAISSLEETASKLDDSGEFRRRRSLYLASSVSDVAMLQREFRSRSRNGFAVEWVSAKELAQNFHLTAPAAILNQQAAEIDPVRLTSALVRNAENRGLTVFGHTHVVSYRREAKSCVVTTSTGRTITARHVVFATGYETQQFLKQKEVKLVSTYAIASEPHVRLHPGFERPVIWESARPYLYVRTTSDSRIIAGGEDVDFLDETERDKLLARKTRTLREKVHSMFPDARWKLAAAWAGTFAQSDDGLPYIGPHPAYPGAFFALGYGGNGITFSAIASRIIPDLIAGKANRDAKLFQFNRL